MEFQGIWGLSCIENHVLAILKQQGQDIVPLYRDAAVPLYVLYTYIFREQGRMEYFDRIPRIQNILKSLGVLDMKRQQGDILTAVKHIERCNDTQRVLLRCQPDFVTNRLHARGLRTDHYVRVQPAGEGSYTLHNDIPEITMTVNAAALDKLYAGEFFTLHFRHPLDDRDIQQLWDTRCYVPENYQPVPDTAYDLSGYADYGARLRDMVGLYKLLAHRLAEYYADFVYGDHLKDMAAIAERFYALIEYYNLKKTIPLSRYEAIVREMNQIETKTLTALQNTLAQPGSSWHLRM